MNKFRQTLVQKQTQNLLLKPKMLQSLEMLAMPLMQLETHLKQEMISNPMLELLEYRDEEDISSEKDDKIKDRIEEDIKKENEDEELKKTLEETKELSEILDSYSEYFRGGSGIAHSTEGINFDQMIKDQENKKDVFVYQIERLNLEKDEFDFAYELFDSTDAHGFLPNNFVMEEYAEEFGIELQRAEEIHLKLLHLEPKGITARSIKECLLAQLDPEFHNENIITLISDHFNDLIHKRYKNIASSFGTSITTILNWKKQIAKLDPKPGLRLLTNHSNYIVPDVIIKRIGSEYEVIINDYSFPRIRLSRRYNKILQEVRKDKEALNYVRSKINSAKFLIKSVYLRSRTLERVTNSILHHQSDFFYGENRVLKPLTYSDIAQELQVNESTISRVVRIKYADTPFGIMCLKDFFTSKAGKDDNYNSISRHNVEQKITRMIDNENEAHPLSDQDIVGQLSKMSIHVSRRVIAKYRKAKGILNSRLRRKE
ncbi:MAG: RNA polymerase factor sigma-54 [Candidatus Tenebribacter burtonii]|jgi:RNA polymerase sigma-54 factor|nr:RNA polymerase factor sigma-54 [Candidatus Tenebribacter burtonii]